MRYSRLGILITMLFFSLSLSYDISGDHHSASGFTVTDAAGRSISLPQIPQRILVVGKAFYITLHVLYMFPEGRMRLIGSERRGAKASEFLSRIDPKFDHKSFLDPNPGPEHIASLKPDLVLAKGNSAGELDDSLSRIGIPVIYLGLETPERFLLDVALLGKILSNEERSNEIIDFYNRRLSRIKGIISTVKDEEKPKSLVVMYTRRGNGSAVQVPAGKWMQTIIIQAGGGFPVWMDSIHSMGSWTIVNMEQIASWNPENIMVIVPHSLNSAELLESLRSDSRWKSLRAVKSGGLTAFPSDLYGWDNPDPRWLLGMIWTSQQLHPEKFAFFDIREEVFSYFSFLYGMEADKIEQLIIPKLNIELDKK